MATVNLYSRSEQFMQHMGLEHEPDMLTQLANIYTWLGASTGLATVAALLQLTNIVNFGLVYAVGLLILLITVRISKKTDSRSYFLRLFEFLAFGFCAGQALGPILTYVLHVSSAIIIISFLSTILVVLSFALTALLTNEAKHLYLAGLLIAAINCMAILSIINSFYPYERLQRIELYIGVVVIIIFALFDMHNIFQKYRQENRHSSQNIFNLLFQMMRFLRQFLSKSVQRYKDRKKSKRKSKQTLN